MKVNLFSIMAFVAGTVLLSACHKEVGQPPMPELSTENTTIELDYEGKGAQSFTIRTNRSFQIVSEVDWLAFSPESMEIEAGDVKEYPISVSAIRNKSEERSAEVMVKILSDYVKLKVVQAGDPEAVPVTVYKNDLDQVKAVEQDDRWPYIDASTVWHNETGSGSKELQYYGKGVTVRANSPSNHSEHSIYPGSGDNNFFFGKEGHFTVGKIALHPKHRGLELTFGSEKYLFGNPDNTFRPEEFPVMVSKDGQKWVSLAYSFPGDVWPDGQWACASARFTLPSETQYLWIRFAPTVASAYRLDDIVLQAADGGPVIDWNKSVDITLTDPIAPAE